MIVFNVNIEQLIMVSNLANNLLKEVNPLFNKNFLIRRVNHNDKNLTCIINNTTVRKLDNSIEVKKLLIDKERTKV